MIKHFITIIAIMASTFVVSQNKSNNPTLTNKNSKMHTAQLLKDVTYNEKRPVTTVLFDTDFTKEIRIAMQKGTVMKEHKTKFPIVVEVVKGIIDFGVDGKLHKLVEGSLIALNPSVPHDLKANENSIIRLTLSKQDETSRVENAVK